MASAERGTAPFFYQRVATQHLLDLLAGHRHAPAVEPSCHRIGINTHARTSDDLQQHLDLHRRHGQPWRPRTSHLPLLPALPLRLRARRVRADVQVEPADRLPRDAAEKDQIQERVVCPHLQPPRQLFVRAAVVGCHDEVLDGGLERAEPGEADAMVVPQAVIVEWARTSHRVVPAGVAVAGEGVEGRQVPEQAAPRAPRPPPLQGGNVHHWGLAEESRQPIREGHDGRRDDESTST